MKLLFNRFTSIVGIWSIGIYFYKIISGFFIVAVEPTSISSPVASPAAPQIIKREDSDQTIKSMAQYLEKDKRLVGQIGADVTPPSGGGIGAKKPLPFSPEWIASLETQDIKEKLNHFETVDNRALVSELNDRITQMDPNNTNEKRKLMQLSFYLDNDNHIGISQDVFFAQADLYFNSSDAGIADIGKRALEYALSFEVDPDSKEEKRKRFYASHEIPRADESNISSNPTPESVNRMPSSE